MDIKKQIELLLKEATLYQSHGLLEDSKTKYNDAIKLIQGSKQLQNGQNLINLILKKISALGQDIHRIEEEALSQQISIKEQEIIKELLFFSKEEDRNATNNPLLQQQESRADKNLETNENDVIDISSIVITLDNGPQKGKEIDLDVNYQRDNTISLIIPKNDKLLIESLKVGLQLDNVQFYSLIGLFIDSAIILDKKQIESGRKKGDYLLNIKILST